jgi:hypothetical protein
MRKFWLFYILVCIWLVSCNAHFDPVQSSNGMTETQATVQITPNLPIVNTATPSRMPIATLAPTISDTPTLTQLPSRTPKPTALPFANAANIGVEGQRLLMKSVINSGKWEQLGLSEPISSRWQAFANGEAGLTPEETHLMVAFLAQWGELTGILEKSQLKEKAQFQFKTMITPSTETGEQIAVFLIDSDSGSGKYLLIVRDAREVAVGLLPAPKIEGVEQRISPDGAYVEYADPKGRVLLLADARKLDIEDAKERKLRDRLEDLYPSTGYFACASYPRYFLPGGEIKSGFYGLEESLSATQILQLNEAVALYNRPDLVVLKNDLLSPQVSVIVTNDLGRALGLTYTGTGVVEIDRQDLFGNKYWIAMVLAHEASHVLQGALPDGAGPCSEIEKREIGNHKIPVDFYSWSAVELVQAVKDSRIGAYHVSLWMLNKLGMKNLQPFQEVINTGKVNGQSVVINCSFSGMR